MGKEQSTDKKWRIHTNGAGNLALIVNSDDKSIGVPLLAVEFAQTIVKQHNESIDQISS